MSAGPLEIARQLDAIYDTNLTNDLVLSLSSAPSYTLAELKELARECANESNVTSDDRTIMLLAFSRLIAWLARREREVEDGSA